jgi:hypothetical protein
MDSKKLQLERVSRFESGRGHQSFQFSSDLPLKLLPKEKPRREGAGESDRTRSVAMRYFQAPADRLGGPV